MVAAVAPELPKEDWDDELTLPSSHLDWEQLVSQATATEGRETDMGEHPVETEDERATARVRPKASAEVQTGVPVEPPNGVPDTTAGENAEANTLDRPPITEPAEERGGIIETGTFEVSEHLGDTTPKVVDEDAEAAQVSSPTLMLDQIGVDELQDMPELEGTEPEQVPGGEPPMAVATIDVEGMPELEDAGPEESIEEYLADTPLIWESLAQPLVWFEAQVCQDEVQYWAAMFTWFRVMHLSWEESRRRKGDE